MPKFRRFVEFLYISTFPSPSPPFSSFYLSQTSRSRPMLAIFAPIATSVIYILSRVFSFITYRTPTVFSPDPPEQYVRFAAGVFNTLIYPRGRKRIVFLLAVEIPKALDAPLTRVEEGGGGGERASSSLPRPLVSHFCLSTQRKGSGVCTRIRGERARTNARSRKFTYT